MKSVQDNIIYLPHAEIEALRLLSVPLSVFQDYKHYTEQDHKTWCYVMSNLIETLPVYAFPPVVDRIKKLGIPLDKTPRLEIIDLNLKKLSGFSLYGCNAVLEEDTLGAGYYFESFATTNYLRPWEERDYTPIPDLVHEEFHAIMLSFGGYAKVAKIFGATMRAFEYNPLIVKIMKNVHWFAVEFPLCIIDGALRVVGPGILSSIAECKYSIEDSVPMRHIVTPENAEDKIDFICSFDIDISHKQIHYLVFRSFDEWVYIMTNVVPAYIQKKTGLVPKYHIA